MRDHTQHGSILSIQRAFVLHLRDGRRRGRRRFSGRVEHLSSGESTLFSSLKGLLAFIDAVLGIAAPAALADQHEPSGHGGTVALPRPTKAPGGQRYPGNPRPGSCSANRRSPMMSRIASVLAVVLVALIWPLPAIAGPASHVPDEVLVKFRAGMAPAHHAAAHAALGAVPVRRFATVRDLHLVKLPRGLSAAQAIARYRKNPDVLYAEPNFVVTLQATPNDPHFLAGDQWGLDTPVILQDIDVDAPEAWELSTGSPAVVVAIIDS